MKKVCLLFVLCFAAMYSYGATYCTPTFANPCSTYPMETKIQLLAGASGTISDTTNCTSASYENMTALSCTLNAGASYTMTLGVSPTYYHNFSVQIWIDFDGDGSFASSESVGGAGTSTFITATPAVTISLPSSIPTGSTVMRIVGNYSCCGASNYPSMTPCPTTSISYGDARDYTVIIGASGPTLAATSTSLGFGAVAGGTTSSSLTSVVTGAYLTPSSGAITVTAPSDFEVCSTSGGTYSSSYTISYTGATVAATSVFARFVAPSTPGTYTGNIAVSGGGASTVNIAVSGTSGCSGTPAGGTSSYTSASTCGTSTTTLANTGYTTGTGITLQWESSPSGTGSWSTIAGATNATCTIAGATSTTYYRCVVTCSLSSSSATSTLSAIAVDRINGHISFSSTAPDTLDCKVWLIYHDLSAGTLTAVDSTTSCLDAGVAYYEFNGVDTGAFIVKARSLDATSTMVGASGYMPTYGASNVHWDTATTVTHVAGVTDNMNINMLYGTVPAGPGFIGGLITSGAGKNTASDVPAVNMIVFLMDASHHVLTHTYTNATGNYMFSGIASGNYIIYPEELAYATTPSSLIALTTGTPSASGINFKQHVGPKTITPNMSTDIKSVVAASGIGCTLFPNPASDEIMITMEEGAFSSLVVTDYVGSIVAEQSINRSQTKLNIKNLAPGIYYVKLVGEDSSVVKRFVKL